MHFDHLYNSLQILTAAAADGTYGVFLPEGILGATQQQFFGHKGAVQPDSPTEIPRNRNITQLL